MRPIPEEMRLQYKEQFAAVLRLPYPGVPELRARGPDAGGLDRGHPDRGRLPRHPPLHGQQGDRRNSGKETSAARVVAVLSSA